MGRAPKASFPEVYSMATDPKASVASYVTSNKGGMVWQPRLRRAAFEGKIPRTAHLLNRINGTHISLDQVDS